MTTVHWEEPAQVAVAETDGHGDTCGEIAMLDDLVLRFPGKYQPTQAQVDAMRTECIQWHEHSGGMTLYSIGQAMELHFGVKPVKVVPYNAALDFQLFRHDLINALLAHQPCIMQTSLGYKLPNNQPGVLQHFIYIGGIDSLLGYRVSNGDTLAALAHSGYVAPSWVGVNFLQASAPDAYLILPALPAQAPAVNYQEKFNTLVSGLESLVKANA
jgi:hypothetical protein